eukprot:GHUV01031435.1.p1 GENE.GHUV01031435.1~~GHUV01031435.1.p1  ORF type:complete len:147 (-),score=22.88 GHUV01031435.1:823-1263(-)
MAALISSARDCQSDSCTGMRIVRLSAASPHFRQQQTETSGSAVKLRRCQAGTERWQQRASSNSSLCAAAARSTRCQAFTSAWQMNMVFVSQVYAIGNPFGLDHTLTQVRWNGIMLGVAYAARYPTLGGALGQTVVPAGHCTVYLAA